METAEIHTIDGAYMIEFGRVSDGFRVKDLSGDTAPHTYTPPYSLHLYYCTAYGVWRRTTGNGKWEFSSDKTGCGHDYRPVIIGECGIPQHDDMVDAFGYAVAANKDVEKEVKQVTEWYERTQGIDFANPLQPKIKFTSKKEVKGKMKQLIDVIFFNRKTEEVDYRKEIVATDIEEAFMLAAQDYGKYNSKTHARHATCMFSFSEEDK